MHFSTVVAFAALHFLVAAVPVTLNSESSRAARPISIPLTRRSNHWKDDGSVDLGKLQAGLRYRKAFVFPLTFYEEVGSLTDCQLRVFDQALSAYERNTGQPHPHALKRGDSNERRAFVSTPLTVNGVPGINLAWTGDVIVGTPGRSFASQSPFRVTQTSSKLIAKCVVSFDSFTADMFIDGPSCKNCSGKNFYNISLSSTGKNLSSNIATDFGYGRVIGDVVTESVFLGGNEVSHGAYYWFKEGALMGN